MVFSCNVQVVHEPPGEQLGLFDSLFEQDDEWVTQEDSAYIWWSNSHVPFIGST